MTLDQEGPRDEASRNDFDEMIFESLEREDLEEPYPSALHLHAAQMGFTVKLTHKLIHPNIANDRIQRITESVFFVEPADGNVSTTFSLQRQLIQYPNQTSGEATIVSAYVLGNLGVRSGIAAGLDTVSPIVTLQMDKRREHKL